MLTQPFQVGQKVTEKEIMDEKYEYLSVTPLSRYYYHSSHGWLRVTPAWNPYGEYTVKDNGSVRGY